MQSRVHGEVVWPLAAAGGCMKVGSLVRVVARVEGRTAWNALGHMEWTLGQVGIVSGIEERSWEVKFLRCPCPNGMWPGGRSSWYYDPECLELVRE